MLQFQLSAGALVSGLSACDTDNGRRRGDKKEFRGFLDFKGTVKRNKNRNHPRGTDLVGGTGGLRNVSLDSRVKGTVNSNCKAASKNIKTRVHTLTLNGKDRAYISPIYLDL